MISRIRFGPWRRFYAWLKGLVDARCNQPLHAQPPLSDPEQQMVRIATGCIASVYERGERRYRNLEARCRALAQEVLQREARFVDADQEYQRAKDKLHDHLSGKDDLGRPIIPRSQLNWRTYIALMIVLGVGEGAFNFIVFQVFRENLPFTFLMSLAVMAGLPALGHFAGMSTRHRQHILLGWSLIMVGLVAIAGITYLRISFLQGQATASADSPSISTPAMAFAYFFLSVLIFVVAIAVAYFYHEPDEALDGLKKDLEKKERKWSRANWRYTREMKCLRSMSGLLGGTQAYASRTAEGLRDAGIELITIYRRANRNWRRRGDQAPAFFQSYDNVKLQFGPPPEWLVENKVPKDRVAEILDEERKGLAEALGRPPQPQAI